MRGPRKGIRNHEREAKDRHQRQVEAGAKAIQPLVFGPPHLRRTIATLVLRAALRVK